MDSMMTALYSGSAYAVWGAFLWGVAGVLLSPCGMAVIPLVVGYIQASKKPSYWSSFCISVIFSSGIFANLLLVGVLTSNAGSFLARYDYWISRAVGAIFILIGFHLIGLIKLPWFHGKNMNSDGKKGLRGALILGLFSGLALGPCTFAFALPILTLSAKASSADNTLLGISIIAAYGLGHCIVLVLAGTFSGMLGKYMNWSGNTKIKYFLTAVCGALLVLAGGYFIYESFPIGTFF